MHIGILKAYICKYILARIKAKRTTGTRLTRKCMTAITGQNKKPKIIR